MPDDFKRWFEELRADWRELRKEVVEVLRWQSETRPMCDAHTKRLEDHEDRLRVVEKKHQEALVLVKENKALVEKHRSNVETGLTVGTKMVIGAGWLITTGIALAALWLK
jgi:hypothetical protein